MQRNTILVVAAAFGLGACQSTAKQEETKMDSAAMAPAAAAAPAPPSTTEEKISNAMAAAPSAISSAATITDYPSTPDGQPTQLRAGNNGWTCFPDYPESKGNDPACLDAEWVNFMVAWMSKKPPKVTKVGYGYMIAPGGAEGRNTDPFATAPTPDNHWHMDGPHVMVIYPDAKQYDAITSDYNNGGPYVMFKGTPYAHVMWPVK